MNDYELQELMTRRQRAQGLRQTETPEGRMVGNIYVNANPLEYLAAGLRRKAGTAQDEAIGGEINKLRTKREGMDADAMAKFASALRGEPARDIQPLTPNDDDGNPMQVVRKEAVAPDAMAGYSALMGAYNPQLRQAGMQGMAQIPQMQEQRQFQRDQMTAQNQANVEAAQVAQAAKMEQLQMQHQQRMDMLAANNASREQMAQAQREFQRQMAQLSASLRPEKNVTVLGPNGEAITLPQSQAQGLPLYNPQSAAGLQKEKTKQQAKDQLSTVVQQLNNGYDALEKGGGITSTGQGALSNLAARAGATGVGQAIGGALGTENQRQRQEIAQTRPLLLNLIKEATGMSAQQMNSNAEMQLYLQAATDPTLSVEANRSALANLDRLFGLGLAKRPAEGGKPSAQPSAADAQALQWARSNPSDPRAAQIMQRLGAK